MRIWGIGMAALGVLAAVFCVVECASADERDAQGVSAAAPASPGMRVFIDPETGEFGEAPAEPDSDAARLQRVPVVDDLVEEANPAGGYTIHLKRRFGGVARATVDADGLEVECEAGTGDVAD